MTTYRSLSTIQAVQFTGHPIPGVTCHGSPEETLANGCDSSRKNQPHVHSKAVGGMTVLKAGDWIFPLPGGPFGVAADGLFRAHWEIPVPMPAAEPVEPPTPTEDAVNTLLAGFSLPTIGELRQNLRLLDAITAAHPALGEASGATIPSGQLTDEAVPATLPGD